MKVMQNLYLSRLISFFKIFFENDILIRIKKGNNVSGLVPLSQIENEILYQTFKNSSVRSFGWNFQDNVIKIFISC